MAQVFVVKLPEGLVSLVMLLAFKVLLLMLGILNKEYSVLVPAILKSLQYLEEARIE